MMKLIELTQELCYESCKATKSSCANAGYFYVTNLHKTDCKSRKSAEI